MTETQAVRTDPSNEDALRAWNGGDGDYWADNEALFDDSVARYRDRFFAAAGISESDRVLDIGCGTGQTTRRAAQLARPGSALGLDLSSRMLDVARRRAAEQGITNVCFLQANAQIHPFDSASFDITISRTGAMSSATPVLPSRTSAEPCARVDG